MGRRLSVRQGLETIVPVGDWRLFGRSIRGTAGNDTYVTNKGGDKIDVSQGGSDHVSTGNANDEVYFGNAFDPTDFYDGGDGIDSLRLSGEYAALTMTRGMLVNVETIIIDAAGRSHFRLAEDVFGDGDWRVVSLFGSEATAITTLDLSALHRSPLVHGSAGKDIILGGRGADDFYYRLGGRDSFSGGAGFDMVFFGSGLENTGEGVRVDLSVAKAQTVTLGSVALRNVEGVEGTQHADVLTGTGGANWFVLNGGDDRVLAAAGNDLISTGEIRSGNRAGAGIIDGGRGIDLLDFSTFAGDTPVLHVSLAEKGFQQTGLGRYRIANVEGVIGSWNDDTFIGSRGDDILIGLYADDVLRGGAGDDVLAGDGAYELPGEDTYGAWAIDPIGNSYSDGDDVLDGGTGNDSLFGAGGDDRITGGIGADELSGGTGEDRFIYVDARDSRGPGRDTIMDFGAGDRIDVSAIDPDASRAGDQKFHFGATAGRVGDIVAYYEASIDRTVIAFYLDGDTGSDMSIWLKGEIALSAADFVL